MKKILASISMLAFVVMMGMPFAHGINPSEQKGAFGAAVSSIAKSSPGAIAEHVKN